jgi:DASH complex subunit DAD1
MNDLNRKLEEVYGVGKEFTTVADLWGVSLTFLVDQNGADQVAIQCIDTATAGRSFACAGCDFSLLMNLERVCGWAG